MRTAEQHPRPGALDIIKVNLHTLGRLSFRRHILEQLTALAHGITSYKRSLTLDCSVGAHFCNAVFISL